VDLIRDLRASGHKLFYLSNMPASYADELEQRHAFLNWFESGVFSARVQQIKPNADIFNTATARFGVAGADTVFIDDVLHNIDAAQLHGWHGIHFQSAAQVRAEMAYRWPS
jgi:putative hydrolase of the HAD superfamily